MNNYVRDERFFPHFKALNDLFIEADLDVRIEGHFFVEHGRYYIDGVRLVRRDGSAYSFVSEEKYYDDLPRLCVACGGPDGDCPWNEEYQNFLCQLKIPGKYCTDDHCDCGGPGGHATLKGDN